MEFPAYRPRRLRRTETLRRMVRETRLSVDHLILPLFVVPGTQGRQAGRARCPASRSSRSTGPSRNVAPLRDLGIPAVILFGIPEKKDATGSQAYRDDGIVPHAPCARSSRPCRTWW